MHLLEDNTTQITDIPDIERVPIVPKRTVSLTTDTIIKDFPAPAELLRMQQIHAKYQQDKYTPLHEAIPHPRDFFYILRRVSAQRKAVPIENFLIHVLGGVTVHASVDKGDFCIGDAYYELKTSTTNFRESLNIRQIRLWQDVDYYICSYIDEHHLENSAMFRLTKAEMAYEVGRIGRVMHGTKSAVSDNKNKEYGIVINLKNKDNEHTKRWTVRYWYDDLYQQLIKE